MSFHLSTPDSLSAFLTASIHLILGIPGCLRLRGYHSRIAQKLAPLSSRFRTTVAFNKTSYVYYLDIVVRFPDITCTLIVCC